MKHSRSHLVVLGLVIAVLGAVFWVGYSTPIRLGLDLQGGLEVVLQAQPSKGQKLTPDQLQKSVEIIRSRVDALGVSEPEIRTQGSNEIAVALAGEQDPERAVSIVGSTAQLKFYSFEDNVVGSQAYRNVYDLLKHNQSDAQDSLKAAQKKLDDAQKQLDNATSSSDKAKAKKALAKAQFDQQWYMFDAKHQQVATVQDSPDKLTSKAPGGKLPAGWSLLSVPIGDVMVHTLKPDGLPITVSQTGTFDPKKGVFLLMKDNPATTGDAIKSAAAESSQGKWATSMIFKGWGADKFAQLTKKVSRRGALTGQFQHFAIILDDEIKSTPYMDYKQYPNGLSGTTAQIDGMASHQEAQDLALVLNTGALPVKFNVVSKTTVSASLGAQSLRNSLMAGAAGLLVVMVYLILFYRFLGLIADIALLIYAAIFYGIIVGIPITMTLPGIAGMILTIAVAADANIIIFERIREEYRAGRSVPASIQAGYSKGLRTIVDANVVTLITAAVLFIIATGTVRGFALLLFLGTILSMFTAVAATFALLGLMGRMKVFNHGWVIGGSRKPLRFHFRWMSKRKFMFGFTAFIILASISLVAVRGLNLGVDFKSGTKFDVVLARPTNQKDILAVVTKVEPTYAKATVQQTQQAAGSKALPAGESSFSIQLDKLKLQKPTSTGGNANTAQQDAENRVIDALDKQFVVKSKSVTTIGPSFGRQVLQGAIVAIIVSLVLEVLYISIRFERTFAWPVLIALVHDLIVAMGAYALTGREFTSATVAALLTILGYSLYDTIIVFDRVRENVHIMRKSTFARIIDSSLNEVLMRSINTTFVVIGPIAALYIFGGATLQDFAFALLIGIIAGAYSSIIVASPILCWLKEREPMWARRKEIEEGIAAGSSAPSDRTSAAATATPVTVGAEASASPEPAGVAAGVETEQQRRDRRSRAQRRKK